MRSAKELKRVRLSGRAPGPNAVSPRAAETAFTPRSCTYRAPRSTDWPRHPLGDQPNEPPLAPPRVACLLALAGLLAFAATASASTIKLKCSGKGPHNRDSSGTVLCAEPGASRLVSGTLRNDANKPVKGKITVTVSKWIPSGEGWFTIKAGNPFTIDANAQGKFSYAVKTKTKVSVKFEAVGDEAAGISPVAAQSDVSRQLLGTVKKLGGGKVKITVKGTHGQVEDRSGRRIRLRSLRRQAACGAPRRPSSTSATSTASTPTTSTPANSATSSGTGRTRASGSERRARPHPPRRAPPAAAASPGPAGVRRRAGR